MPDLIALGNPLLDYTLHVSDESLKALGLEKGGVHLVSGDDWRDLQDERSYASVTAGGSSANVTASYALLGGDAALFGAVGTDKAGDRYAESLDTLNVESHLGRVDTATGGALTLITPDGERTFMTYLGAAVHADHTMLDLEAIERTEYLHIEAFQFETETNRDAALHAMQGTDATVSIDLADPRVCRERRELLTHIITNHADIVIGNEREARAFGDLHGLAPLTAVTHGEQGSTVHHNDTVYDIPAYEAELHNTNGAGDAYDAGLLYGLSQGWPVERSAHLGSYAAARAVEAEGARPDRIDVEEFLNSDTLKR